MKLGIASLAVSVLLGVGNANAQRLPTDVELKAAYCVKVVQNAVEVGKRASAETATSPSAKAFTDQLLKDSQDRLARLQSYLEPRMSSLEPVSMTAAMKRGESDAANYEQEYWKIADQCDCPSLVGPSGELSPLAAKCLDECVSQNPLVERIQACRNLNWLPPAPNKTEPPSK